MAQRREQSTASAGITTLTISSGLGADYIYMGNKESTLGWSYAPYSRGDAAVQHKLAAHKGELSTRCDDTFPVSYQPLIHRHSASALILMCSYHTDVLIIIIMVVMI